VSLLIAPAIFATYFPFCTAALQRTVSPAEAQRRIPEVWQAPTDIASRDLVYGPWGQEHAPDPEATFSFRHAKTHGVSPGLTVTDAGDREWSVKVGPEGPVEVVVSRVLSAVGYHQPPVYFLKTFRMKDEHGLRTLPGGRFRPRVKELKELDDWSWQENPFVGTKPYQGLLVILMLLDSSDLKNSNNSMYEFKPKEGWPRRWYVVRDLGTALGETGRLDPKRNDPDIFERHKFISGVHDGFVEFSYHGWHRELYRNRVMPDDVKWACDLTAQLTDRQWADAFTTAGYEPEVAARFIAALKARIDEGRHIDQQLSSR
jgi:hypothetical protein